MRCIYCEQEIDNTTPTVNVGGEPMHARCQVLYGDELYGADLDDDLDDDDWLEDFDAVEHWDDVHAALYADDQEFSSDWG